MILRRYIIGQVLLTTVVVLLFLVVMLLGGRLIRYFGMAAEGSLALDVLFRLIFYNLPYFLELLLPLSFFMALMLVFGRLYADNEMAVINASGMSRSQLGRLLLPLVVALMACEAYLSLVAKPWGVRQSEQIWQEQESPSLLAMVRPKTFISHDNYHLYVGEIDKANRQLGDIVLIENIISPRTATTAKDVIIVAKKATQSMGSDGGIGLELHSGRRYEFNPHTRQYHEVGFERYRLSFGANYQKTASDRIETVDSGELLTMMTHADPKTASQASAELGYRLSLPWLLALAVMLSLPLSYTKPRQSRWGRLLPALLIFLLAMLAVIALKNAIAKQKIPQASYAMGLALMFVLALYANYHQRLWYRYRLARPTASISSQEVS